MEVTVRKSAFGRMSFLSPSSALLVIGAEGDAVLLGAQLLGENGEAGVLIGIGGSNRLIYDDGIHGAAAQLSEALEEAVTGRELAEGLGQALKVAALGQEGLAGGAQLHGHVLAGQIRGGLDVAAFLDHDDLGVIIVGGGESVAGFLHAVEDGHAGPNAIALFSIQLRQLLLPVDGEDLHLPAQLIAGRLGNLNVKAGVAAVIAQVAEGRILGIDADRKDLLAVGVVIDLLAAAGQQGNGHQHCQQQAQGFLHILHICLLLFPAGYLHRPISYCTIILPL